MRRLTPCFFVPLLFISVAVCYAQGQNDVLQDGKMHLELTPYLIFPGMSGDVTVKGNTQPINASVGDIFGHLQFGFMARSQISYNRFFVGTDTVYMGLGGANSAVNAGFDQWAAELLGGYRLHPRLAILTGVRYNDLSADLKLAGPLATHLRATQVWWDPFFGGVANLPLSKKINASARLDVGGFGAGSRIAINSEPFVNYRINKSLMGIAGWKFMYQDYVNSGQQFEYDVLTQGPVLGISMRW